MSNPSTVQPLPGEEGKKETKRRRNQLSCAECRRLKIFTVAQLYHLYRYYTDATEYFLANPVGKEVAQPSAPKGTRFVLANTEELHAKIVDMSERIRQLENAIAASTSSTEPHPLLREDLLLIKVPIEFKNDMNSPPKDPMPEPPPKDKDAFPTLLDAFGTLKIGADGHSRFFGQTARTEHFVKDESDPPLPDTSEVQNLLPPDILHLSQAFPFGSSSQDFPLIQVILEFVPPISETWSMVDVYFSNSAWIYEPCPRPQFEEEILKHVYENINDPEGILPHRLALFFAVLSHGVLTDINRAPYSAYAEQLHQLARASLAASPFLQEPTLPVIQAMFLIGFYLVLVNRKEAASTGWALQGLNCKLAEMLGLHRDLEYWDAEDKRSHGEARRKVFWELVTLDGWMSLGLGRPATIHFSQLDCKPPAASQRAQKNPECWWLSALYLLCQTYEIDLVHVWHTWKHGLARHVNRVLQMALDPQTPSYADILELDRDIHSYDMPADVEALANGTLHRQAYLICVQFGFDLRGVSLVILLLHRGFFAQALSEKADPMQSKFAPSVLATYRSACYIVLALHNVYTQHPSLSCRYGLFWSNGFSASIALCLMITRATRSSYAPFALGQLDLAYDLFSRAVSECAPAAKALPIMTRLRDKAHAAYAPYRNGQHPASLASKRHLPVEHDDEELSILGGKTNLVASPPQSVPLSQSAGTATHKYELVYPTSPGMVLQLPPTNHLDSVHPSLVQYLAQSPLPRPSSIAHDNAIHANLYHHQSQHTPVTATSHSHAYSEYSYVPSVNSSSSSALAAAMPGYDRISTSAQQEQSDIHQPPSQSQYAAWQNYMEQLGLPY
ncbi:hypothetical protein BU17DRAFT_98829 [Hysterangium stoloniferum]|nr:hypothetical protein BU17DRAFT_98829 [Hysterangium stoloniferum]